MAIAVNRPSLKLFETRQIVDFKAGSGAGFQDFTIQEGSRIIVSLIVRNLSGGGSVDLSIENSGDGDNWLEVLSFSAGVNGISQKIYSDFHGIFRINYIVSGLADVKVIITVRDNSASTFIENANLLVDIDHTKGDSVQVGDGEDVLAVNDDGSINVQLVENANSRHYMFADNTINPNVDGYGYKQIASYTAIDSLDRIRKMYVHSQGSAQIRMLIDGQEVRVKDVDPMTSVAEIVFEVPKPLIVGNVLTIQARIAPEIKKPILFRTIAIEAYKAS
jgi:hypothetical protein